MLDEIAQLKSDYVKRIYFDELFAQGVEVGQVAVVGQGDAARLEVGEHRLDVADEAAAGGGIAGVADGEAAGQAAREVSAAEGVAHVAHVPLGVEPLAVEAGDAYLWRWHGYLFTDPCRSMRVILSTLALKISHAGLEVESRSRCGYWTSRGRLAPLANNALQLASLSVGRRPGSGQS